MKQVAQRATIAHLRANINLWRLFRCSRAANSTVSCPIWLKIEFIQILCKILCTRDDQKLHGLSSLLSNGLDKPIQISSNDTWTYMQQMWKIWSTLVDALEIGDGFTKPTRPITEHVRNDVHFGIAI